MPKTKLTFGQRDIIVCIGKGATHSEVRKEIERIYGKRMYDYDIISRLCAIIKVLANGKKFSE